MAILLETYKDTKECRYKNERYSVRDNGAVFKHARKNRRTRPTDNKWTFGKLNKRTGYLEIASVRIHRIIATAFHGEPSSKLLVVDHIDTNKHNNRPENLRWVTRLENVLLNPITLRRIELICGSAEAFLADPSKFRDKFQNPNYEWMCGVSKEEAQLSKERLLAWAKSNKPLQGGTLGEWIFNKEIPQTESISQPNYIISKTPNAAQRIVFQNDKPNEFPSTPQTIEGNPLTTYFENLKEGKPFFRNHNGEYVIVKSGYSKDMQSIYVLTRSDYVYREKEDGEYTTVPISELNEEVSIKDLPHSLSEVTYVDDLYLHSRVETGFHPREELERIFAEYTQDL